MAKYGSTYGNQGTEFGMGFGSTYGDTYGDTSGQKYGQDMFDEEERRRRRKEQEAAAAKAGNTEVATTEVKQYADGSQTKTTTQEVPPAAGPVAPQVDYSLAPTRLPNAQPQPQAAQRPVTTVDPFQQIRYQESRGRDFDAQGRPLTSPVGARYANQVMPATARQPGFGIRPAASDTPEEYNRVGRELFGAMQNRYGDNNLAAAAYHSGSGNVDKALAWSKQTGQPWLQAPTLGPAGRAYVAEFQKAQGSQQQQMAQTQPAVEAPVEKTPLQLGQERYYANQDNMKELVNMRDDQNVPEYLRRRASDRVMTMLVNQNEQRKAEGQVKKALAEGNNKVLADTMAGKKNGLGDWAEFILLGFLSPQLAAKKAIAMDIAPTRWQQTTIRDAEGNEIPAEVELRADGRIRSGYLQDENQTPLTKEQLGQAVSGGGRLGKGTSLSAEVYVDQKTGRRYRSGYDSSGNTAYVSVSGGPAFKGDEKDLVPQSIGTAGAKAEATAAVGLRYAGPMSYATQNAKDVAAFNQANGTNLGFVTPEPGAPLVDLNTGQPVTRNNNGTINVVRTAPAQGGAAPAPSYAPAPAAARPAAPAPAAAPAAATGTVAPRFREAGFESESPAQFKEREKQYSARATKESEIAGEDIATVRKNQGKAERQADYLLTKLDELVGNPAKKIDPHPGFETSVGAQGASYLFGVLDKPLPPQLGGGPARDFQNRAREILGGAFLQGIEAMKGFGTLTDAEGKAAQAAIQRIGYIDPKTNLPVITGTEAEVREAVKDFQEIIQRNVDANRSKLGQPPLYGTPPESQRSRASASMSPADKARAELERRRRGQ